MNAKTDEGCDAVGAPVEAPVRRLEPERAACAHPNKVETHFTYGYRMHCPDCKHSEESWLD